MGTQGRCNQWGECHCGCVQKSGYAGASNLTPCMAKIIIGNVDCKQIRFLLVIFFQNNNRNYQSIFVVETYFFFIVIIFKQEMQDKNSKECE